jgi:hypothetical protein
MLGQYGKGQVGSALIASTGLSEPGPGFLAAQTIQSHGDAMLSRRTGEALYTSCFEGNLEERMVRIESLANLESRNREFRKQILRRELASLEQQMMTIRHKND